MSRLQQQLGEPYLRDLSLGYLPGTLRNPTHPDTALAAATPTTGATFASIREAMPVLPWTVATRLSWHRGAPLRGKSCSRTTRTSSTSNPPSGTRRTWSVRAFALRQLPRRISLRADRAHARLRLGTDHSRKRRPRFFGERPDPTDSNKVITAGQSVPLQLREEIIKVKDSADVRLVCRSGPHGPICSDVMKDFASLTKDPLP